MNFKRHVHNILRVSFHCPGESRRSRGSCVGAVDEPTMSFEMRSTSAVHDKDSILRIVLAGRMVEVYDTAVPAHMVMEKYPGLRLTRPEVFRSPHDSLVRPREMLFPGQKFYLVPVSTLEKLKRNYSKKVRVEETVLDQTEEPKCAEKTAEGYVCSAKDFYVSQDAWNLCFERRFMREEKKEEEEEEEEQQAKRTFTPPIKKMRMRHGLLDGWKPNLLPIKELSP